MRNLALAVNSDAVREENDFYATDPAALECALPLLKMCGLKQDVWEPACGQGHLSKVLVSHGYNVRSSDLIDRGYGEVQDFLECNEKWHGDILTNPPFKYASEFIKKAFELLDEGGKVFLFLKIQFLEGEKRRKLFQQYPLKYLLVYSKRQRCFKAGEVLQINSPTTCFAWYVFQKGYEERPVIYWID